MLGELERTGRTIERATRPETVCTVTLLVHFALASVKLPAAILSGSVGLLNDALDTLADGVSSLFVFLGVRSGCERLVSYLLVVFMGATGLFSLYEAVRRFIRPEALTVEPLAVAILILKGAVELLTDLIRSAGEEEPDLSRWVFSANEARRHRQTVRWLLYEIDSGRIHTRDQMMKEARAATDFSEIASFRALGIDEQAGREEKLERAASEVFERGLALEVGENPGRLTLTETGRAELDRVLSRGPAVFAPGEFPRDGSSSAEAVVRRR